MSAIERRGSQGRSTYDLLSWSDSPNASEAKTPVRVSATNDSKGYTTANDETCTEPPPPRSAIKILQPSGVSQIAFGEGDNSFQKRASTHAEVAKQRELSGSQETSEDQPRRPMSNAKAKEMSGSNIFGPAPSSGSQGQRAHNQKAAELSGNGIFRKDGYGAPMEKSLSDAKRREMTGSDIFSEDRAPPSHHPVTNRNRKPPDAITKIKQLSGSNPVKHDEKAAPEMSDKHISEAKVKEMCGNHDLFNREMIKENNSSLCNSNNVVRGLSEACSRPPSRQGSDSRRSEKLHSNAKRREIVGNYDLLSYAPNRHDNADYIKYPSERPASRAKLRELSGSYVFGDCFTDNELQ